MPQSLDTVVSLRHICAVAATEMLQLRLETAMPMGRCRLCTKLILISRKWIFRA